MSQKRNIVNKQIYAFCVFVETINGKEEEQKTVVPKRWLDKKNSLLWWPRGINVTSKKFSDPNESSWKQYKLIEVLMEGNKLFSTVFHKDLSVSNYYETCLFVEFLNSFIY